MSHFIFNMFKRWYLLREYKMKTRIYATPAVKGLKVWKSISVSDVIHSSIYLIRGLFDTDKYHSYGNKLNNRLKSRASKDCIYKNYYGRTM